MHHEFFSAAESSSDKDLCLAVKRQNTAKARYSHTNNNEKIYSIQLEEKNRQTDIVITDKDLKPLSDETSNKLLTLLEESIRADLATK
jgi:5'-3' exonuclease